MHEITKWCAVHGVIISDMYNMVLTEINSRNNYQERAPWILVS